ncbi:MAG: hypothetical protein SF162_06500 [bacterium]|nr:hypothetical protein [bacterium]
MNTERVLEMAKSFQNMSNVLEGVNRALEIAMDVLNTTAFIGLVGGAVWSRYIGMIKPVVQRMADYCAEIDRDLRSAVTAYMNEDAQGATRFY